MTTVNKILIGAALGLGALANGYETLLIFGQRRRIEAQTEQLAQREAEARQGRLQLDLLRQQLQAAERQLSVKRREIASAASSQAALLRACIIGLKQLLEEMPDQKIPEFKMLGPKDWIEVAQQLLSGVKDPGRPHGSLFLELRALATTTRSGDPIDTAFSELRKKAKWNFAEKLQDTLRRFLAGSKDELPSDILQLAPYLATPATVEMLQRYQMLRAGKTGAKEERVIGEKPFATEARDGRLSIGLNDAQTNYSRSSELNQDVKAAFAKGMGKALEDLNPGDIFGRAFGDVETFKNDMRGGIARFSADHAGRLPATLQELRPYLQHFNAARFSEDFRPLLATLAFAVAHDLAFPTDAAQLRPYLEKPVDLEALLRATKIGPDGRSIEFKLGVE